MISEGGVTLGPHKRIDLEVFSFNKDEEELDSLIIAFAAWFNDLKTYQLHAMQSELRAKTWVEAVKSGIKPTREDEMEGRLATSHSNHAYRLMAAHLVELFEMIKQNEETLKHRVFISAGNNIAKERQIYLDVILRCGTDQLPPSEKTETFLKLKKLFVKMRSSGTYHYSNVRYFKKGFIHYFKDKEGNEPYYCLAESPGGTRFFFADRVQEKIFEELAIYDIRAINEFTDIAQHAIKDLIESYIIVKEKALKELRISKWRFTKLQ